MNESYENHNDPTFEDPISEFHNEYHYTPPKKEKRGWSTGVLIVITLICSLLGGILGAGCMYLTGTLDGEAQEQFDGSDANKNDSTQTGDAQGNTTILVGNRENVVIDINKIDTDKLMTQAEVYAANVNSTVGITTSITTNYWGYQTTSAASGSGFIFSKDGYILTNYHVVEDSNSITVSMYDGTTHAAKLIGYDESNDVAVLKIDANNLAPVVLGNSDNLNVGDSVVAIGNPLGELTYSLTDGLVSALDRLITTTSTNPLLRLI